MLLTESKLSEGRINRAVLQGHLRLCIAIPADMLCSHSGDGLELFVSPLLINVTHINSCLQRTMIKRWKHGFHNSCAEDDCESVMCLSGAQGLETTKFLRQERKRLEFIKEYRAAYALVCQAAERLQSLTRMHRRTWDEHTSKQRQKSITAIQQGLMNYCCIVSDLVLSLLPGQTFLKVYSEEDKQ